jgi:cobalamin synthase
MKTQWRLFMAALRFVALGSAAALDSYDGVPVPNACRFIPVAGVVLGLAGAAVYWLSAQLWPTSIAVVLSMLAMVDVRLGKSTTLHRVFFVLIKYNALMALSSAKIPYPLPEDLTLGLIMICGQAASRALVVSVMATDLPVALRISALDLGIALTLGLAPAAVLGIPGLIGLAAAIAVRMGQRAYPESLPLMGFMDRLDITQQLTELCFYLGALAAWRYV